MLAASLIETPLIITAGMSDEELAAEWDAMVRRSKLTQQLIDGQIDWEFYFDWMAQHGYEPAELLDTAEENLEFAIKEEIFIER
ncbi:hypothetical protein [Leptolyngbya sp. 7M]|uniref:hypothetical protein n=1 Tax=Leptolyngbya sp. 7M TaxID=2812896 RepID=UPI001B8D7311|nr:hypothetical protein [Leptolyngbya sp. 7M]QYO62784.1 hypothetical protein JVX88_22515 [Leptolyngbya sp. 7M]